MKIFIDTADIDEIKEALSWGIVDGVTTNPSLIKKAQEKHKISDMALYINTLLKAAGPGKDVSLEVIGTTANDMISQAEILYKKFNPVAKNVIIKVPINPSPTEAPSYDGLKTIKALAQQGIPTNVTLIFTPEQALLAAKAGAKYVSPFAGRIDDFLRKNADIKFDKSDYYPAEGKEAEDALIEDNGIVSGVDLVAQIRAAFDNYDIKCEIIAASLRNTRQVREVALAGSDVATIPFDVLNKMLTHAKTTEGVNSFLKDTVKEYEEVFN